MLIMPGTLAQQDAGVQGGVPPSVASIEASVSFSGTTHTISLGSTVASGDLLIVWAANDGGSSDLPATTAQGWERIASYGSNAGSGLGAGVGIFKKLADGTEGGTTISLTTPSSEHLVAHCFRIQDWSGTIGDVVVGSVQHTNSGTSVVVPGMTSGWGVVGTLWIAGVSTSNSVTMTSGPNGYTVTQTGEVGANTGQIRTGWKTSVAASEGNATFTFTSGTIYASANMIAVKGS